MEMGDFNYEASQLAQLPEAAMYRLKITADSGPGETKWLTVSARKLDMIRGILTTPEPWLTSSLMDRARKLDAMIRDIAEVTPYEFDRHKEGAPVGTEGWHDYAGDVLAASHNKRVISMDRRNELQQELYVVWTGDTSSDTPE